MKCRPLLISLALLVPISTTAEGTFAANESKMSQTIVRAGSPPATQGPAEYFTGEVTIEPLNGKNVEWMEKVTDGQYRKQ